MRYLKERNVYVLFNTNGTLLTEANGQALIDAGLDELRVSLDAAEPSVFQMVRGKDMFDRIVTNVRRFRAMQRDQGGAGPRVSLWLTGLKETLDQLESFVRIADSVDVREVYLQRLVFFTENSIGLARAESALFESDVEETEAVIARAVALAESLGILFNASGATEPETSIHKRQDDSPWSLCRRPWSLMYFTANGRSIPCCIAPFSMHNYDSYTPRRCHPADAARDLERRGLPGLPRKADEPGAAAGMRQLRSSLESVNSRISIIIPALNEEQAIGAVVRDARAQGPREVIVVDNGSTDRTAAVAADAGARVISEPTRGYGRACRSGAQAADPASDILVFLDGDGSDVLKELDRIAGPVLAGEQDFVIGSRIAGKREPGSMLPSQVFAGWMRESCCAPCTRSTTPTWVPFALSPDLRSHSYRCQK